MIVVFLAGAALAAGLLLVPGLLSASLPRPDPAGFPVECATRGSGSASTIDESACFQLGRHVAAPFQEAAARSCSDLVAAADYHWQGLAGAGETTPLATTFVCAAPHG